MRKTILVFSLVAILLFSLTVLNPLTGVWGAKVIHKNVTATPSAQASSRSLTELLNPDGTPNLSSGVQGSFNTNGYRMELTPSGAPRFIAQACGTPSSEGWDTQFSSNFITGDSFGSFSNSTPGDVRAIAVSGNDVYIGGSFTAIGNVKANKIAKWNGNTWSAIGSNGGNGVGGSSFSSVNAIAVSGSDVYVGGSFGQANIGGTVVGTSNIAKWNGSVWSALTGGTGNGVNSIVYTIAVSGSDVFVGGSFTQANVGGTVVSTSAIAKWNGGTWSALGSNGGTGLGNTGTAFVFAIAIVGSDVYAGGSFTTANIGGATVAVNNIAKWNGTTWSALGNAGGNGVGGTVNAIAVGGSNVYVGGSFTQTNIGGALVPANSIAQWDGSNWMPVGSGFDGQVTSIAVNGNDIFVGGYRAQTIVSNQVYLNILKKWDGSNWTAISNETNVSLSQSKITGIATGTAGVFVIGSFSPDNFSGTVAPSNWVAKIESDKLNLVQTNGNGLGLDGVVYAIAVKGTDIYVGGSFTTIGNIRANRVAKWDGSGWSALGTNDSNYSNGLDGVVYSIAVSGDDVYFGGVFSKAFNGSQIVQTSNIVKWNNGNWQTLGKGLFGSISAVNAIAVSGTSVYAGGRFEQDGFTALRNIAKWNGSVWTALGNGGGSGVDSDVLAIAVTGTDVYVGGRFLNANIGGTLVPVNKIAKWNGSSWSALGSNGGNGISTSSLDIVTAIAINGNDIFIGGIFRSVNGGGTTITAQSLARWDGNKWNAVGTGLIGRANSIINNYTRAGFGIGTPFGMVTSISVRGSDIYVGGGFTSIGGVAANNFAKWNGSEWSAVGAGSNNGVNGLVNASTFIANDIYIGGEFNYAGGTLSTYFGRYRAATATTTTLNSPQVTPVYGQSATFVATITSGSNPVTSGCVTLKEGTTILAANVPLDTAGKATFVTSQLGAGAHALTAEFNGSGVFGTSSSNTNINVQKATLTLQAIDSSKVYGAQLPPLSSELKGFVNGENSSVLTGVPGIPTTTATENSAVGNYPIIPTLGTLASANYDFSLVNGTLTVTKANSSITLSSSLNPAIIGQSVTLTAIVLPATATGNVDFLINGTLLGTALVNNGTATISKADLPAGNFSLQAIYKGDTNLFDSRSAELLQTVKNTPTGTNVTVQFDNVDVTFANVSQGGETTITPISPESAGTLPQSFRLTDGAQAWEITTTSVFSGSITLTFNVIGVSDENVFARLRVLHGESGNLVDRTILEPDTPAPNFESKKISARVNSLSPFVLALASDSTNPAVSDQRAGSVLVFPYYSSKRSANSNTRISITNLSGKESNAANPNYAYVHLFFIDGASCQQANFTICLTPNGSIIFTTLDVDPETTGWLLAVAVDANGNPLQNNVLIGNAFIKDGEYVGNYGAEAFWANSANVATITDNKATLKFDGIGYDLVPQGLATEIQSPKNASGQKIVTVGLSGDLVDGQLEGAGQNGGGAVYNPEMRGAPFGSFEKFLSGRCQAVATVSESNPRVPFTLGGLIPNGQSGVIRFNIGAGVGIIMTPRTSKWSGIRSLHKVLVKMSTITIPIVMPTC